MALMSMTGYGRGDFVADGVHVVVEISTVNRKQLDVCLRLPKQLLQMEPRVHELLRQHLNRGRVSGEIAITFTGDVRKSCVKIDEVLAEDIVTQLREVGKKLKLVDDLSVRSLLRMQDVVRMEEKEMDPEWLWGIVLPAIEEAVLQVVSMRKKEGETLQAVMIKRLAGMQAMTEQIEKQAPAVAEKYRIQLLERLAAAGIEMDDPEGRLLKEIALYADRCDITEEITRLRSHCEQSIDRMKDGEPVGRALDFLAQELFREINTIGSKANDAEIIGMVVSFKSEIEKFREQVQNVE
ncbi:MAG: YicC family protein [Spartobacteria bacterium]|nr:YicC family protein [Spartobacteria bacterium]